MLLEKACVASLPRGRPVTQSVVQNQASGWSCCWQLTLVRAKSQSGHGEGEGVVEATVLSPGTEVMCLITF